MENTFYEKADKLREVLFGVLFDGVYDYDKLHDAWRNYFYAYLESRCWNEAAIRDMFEWGAHGHNWKRLHWDNEPETPEQFKEQMDTMRSEVIYSSDRMSMDRLLRAHFMYNTIQSKEALKRYINS